METKTYHTMEYYELDDLINKYFPQIEFEFVAVEEMSNDTDKDMGKITKKDMDDWSEWDKEEWDTYITGKKYPMYNTHLFLHYFVHEDILPEGNYLIAVSW